VVEVLDSLMGCDLGNICAKAERQTCEKSVTENVDYFQIQTHTNRRERERTNVTNDDVFQSVCSAHLRLIFVVCADLTDSP
jgi:hypothetical protein